MLSRKPKRGKIGGRKIRKSTIPGRISIHERPDTINERGEFGHLEGDLMFTSGDQSASVTTIVERKSRFITLIKNDSKHSPVVISGIFNALAPFPEELRKSITFDNGTEFTEHLLLNTFMKIKTYFCDPHSPWQIGGTMLSI